LLTKQQAHQQKYKTAKKRTPISNNRENIIKNNLYYMELNIDLTEVELDF